MNVRGCQRVILLSPILSLVVVVVTSWSSPLTTPFFCRLHVFARSAVISVDSNPGAYKPLLPNKMLDVWFLYSADLVLYD